VAPPHWAVSPPQILFDDEHLRVVFRPGGSDWLLVTFGDALERAEGTRFHAETVAQKQGLNCLGFMAKAANWYPAGSMRAAFPEIAFTLRAFDTRLLYGSSMGGYAAIKYSRLLGATHVVAHSPQWSIDPAECGGHPSGYEGNFTPTMQGMGVRREDAGGSVNIFYDPWHEIDAWHFRMIEAACATVRGYRVPHADHHVVTMLKGASVAAALWDGIRRDDVAHVYRVINQMRRTNGFRRQNILLRLAHRRPMLALQMIAALRAKHQLDLPHPPAVLVPLFRALARQGGREAALRLLEAVPTFLEGPRRYVVMRQLAAPDPANWQRGLLTAHGTRLVYCALEGRLLHVAAPADAAASIGLFGVFLNGGNGICSLAIGSGGATLACARQESGCVHLVPPEACATSELFCAENAGGPVVHLLNRGFYLCAEPDGRTSCDRPRAGPWENFWVE
jgi:hypothetical protein